MSETGVRAGFTGVPSGYSGALAGPGWLDCMASATANLSLSP